MKEIEIAAMTWREKVDARAKLFSALTPAYHAYTVVVRRTERTICRVFATDVDGARRAFGKMYGQGMSPHALASGFRFIRTTDKR